MLQIRQQSRRREQERRKRHPECIFWHLQGLFWAEPIGNPPSTHGRGHPTQPRCATSSDTGWDRNPAHLWVTAHAAKFEENETFINMGRSKAESTAEKYKREEKIREQIRVACGYIFGGDMFFFDYKMLTSIRDYETPANSRPEFANNRQRSSGFARVCARQNSGAAGSAVTTHERPFCRIAPR